MTYDLLLKGGTLIDPSEAVHAVKDIGFSDGIVKDVGDNLSDREAAEVLDCAGQFVSPGWIDFHVHVFWGCSHYGIEPDPYCIAKGVTTAVDAGSAGADTVDGFQKHVVEKSDTRLFAFLHISSQGLLSKDIGELEHMEYANVSRTVEMIQKYPDLMLGVKVRLTNKLVIPSAGLRPLHLAREAADRVGLPMMVHPQNAWCESLDDILAVMRKGDVLTHCFHGLACGVLDDDGNLRASVQDAMERGVIYDVGHGRGSFNWEVAERAMEKGLLPYTISSDLHIYNVDGPVFDLATTLSKFLYLGISLDDVLARATQHPAQILGKSDQLGTLKKGACGDAVVFQVDSGSFDFVDAHGQGRTGEKRLTPTNVIRAGKIHGGIT
jgi:dihydroorotase